jgi:hypothetical protein
VFQEVKSIKRELEARGEPAQHYVGASEATSVVNIPTEDCSLPSFIYVVQGQVYKAWHTYK